jgi:DNA-directed RNA polymerase specialized sigma24 family protein
LVQVLQAVAEGLSYEAAGRIFKVEPDVVKRRLRRRLVSVTW